MTPNLSHIGAILDSAILAYKRPYEREELLRLILEACRPSFSQVIIEQDGDELVRKCPTCKGVKRIYRIHWRSLYVPVLRLFSNGERYTTAQIAKRFPMDVTATVRKCCSELVNYGLLTGLEAKRGGYTLYRASDDLEWFLRGELPVPSWCWPEGTALPEGVPMEGERQFIDELKQKHDPQSKEEHVVNSVLVSSHII